MSYLKAAAFNNTVMWFENPAANWLQSLPLGNGHIGCMINNDPYCETLSLNDDALWSGFERDYCKGDFKENLAEVRKLMAAGKRAEAEKIVENRLSNRFTQAYMPFGDIIIRSSEGEVENYIRALDMEKGIAFARYMKSGNPIETETWISYPDDVLIHKIGSKACADYELSFQSRIMHEVFYDADGFTVEGCAPSDISIADVGNFYSHNNKVSYSEAEKSIKIAARAKIRTDGRIAVRSDQLIISGAKEITVIYSSATSYQFGQEYQERCFATAVNACKKGTTLIKKTHIEDHAPLFNRVHLELGGGEASCDERFARMRSGRICNSDICLLFHFGRYLLIGASRKGTQAANLQGIWNKDLIPPWWCGYTLNINLQMNYWLADRTNLSECFEPFADFVKRLCETGQRTALSDYGVKGAVAHHQSDIWAHSTPVGYDVCQIPLSARWMMWNMPLPWLCIQLYDHYLFTLDAQFLKSVLFPIMKNTAEFMVNSFTEINGLYCNVPSTSPENMYRDTEGNELAICNMSAMDIGLSKDFFKAYIETCKQLGEYAEAERCEMFANRIPDYAVSGEGDLLEWDNDYEETEKGHRHFSLLYGVYPGSHLINSRYAKAAESTLLKRLRNGGGQTGWSAVWAIALLARFGEGEAAYDVIKKLCSENIHENMFGAHPPDLFQIDANFGFTAAICELIIQEYDGVIRLLPALPKPMESGSIIGLKIYHGHEISLRWEAARIVFMEIRAAIDDEIVVDVDDLISDNTEYAVAAGETRIWLKKNNLHRFFKE